jgi:hypothetical protein
MPRKNNGPPATASMKPQASLLQPLVIVHGPVPFALPSAACTSILSRRGACQPLCTLLHIRLLSRPDCCSDGAWLFMKHDCVHGSPRPLGATPGRALLLAAFKLAWHALGKCLAAVPAWCTTCSHASCHCFASHLLGFQGLVFNTGPLDDTFTTTCTAPAGCARRVQHGRHRALGV